MELFFDESQIASHDSTAFFPFTDCKILEQKMTSASQKRQDGLSQRVHLA